MENKKSTSLTNNKCCGNGNFNEIHVCEKQPSSDSYREDSKTAPSYVRVASASSSEFDAGEAAHFVDLEFGDQQGLSYENVVTAMRWQHARDAEEIAALKKMNRMLIPDAGYYEKLNDDAIRSENRLIEITKLTEENQRLTAEIIFHKGVCLELADRNAEKKERIERLTAALKSLRHAIIGHKGNGEVIPMIDDALAADGGAE